MEIKNDSEFYTYNASGEIKNTVVSTALMEKLYSSEKDFFDSQVNLTHNKSNDTIKTEGGLSMNDREYVDAKINALETNMNQKIQAQGELFTEKLRHIETKLDSNQSILMAKLDTISNGITQQQEIFKRDVEIITENKINALKEKMKEEQKETRKNMWQIAAAVATIASLAIAALQYFTS